MTIGGLLVGGLTAAEARALVESRFNKPIALVVSDTKKVAGDARGARREGGLPEGGEAGRSRPPARYQVPLRVDVSNGKLERYLASLAKKTDREAGRRDR